MMVHTYISFCGCISLFAAISYANPINDQQWSRRALAEAPNGYVPSFSSCGTKQPQIRQPFDVSPEEKDWLQKRRPVVAKAMRKFLKHVNISNFDSDKYFDQVEGTDNQPVVGIAVSGGGYRALLTGAGALAAFDDRTRGSKGKGHLGGLLQSTTYLSGLSGGGWLVGSLYANNFTSVEAILDASAAGHGYLWDFNRSILDGPPEGSKLFRRLDHWKVIHDEVKDKRAAGFNSSITDYWGRGLSFQLINATDGGPAYTFSSIVDQPGFGNGELPMPMLVSTGRAFGEILVPRNTTVFEFNPWEMGSWDPQLFGMAPIKYVGSRFEGGKAHGACIRGFDNMGFIMGTSSSLWNEFAIALLGAHPTGILGALASKIHELAVDISSSDNDIANWTPNPFFGWNSGRDKGVTSHTLTLADGGEDYQNIPLYPQIQPPRKVDVIFAVDSSADHGGPDLAGFPNGTALIATYERNKGSIANGTVFPSVPDWNTFVNLGLSTTPTFFGCDSKNLSGPAPLLVYLPNAPYDHWSNLSTKTTHLKDVERSRMIENGYNVATMANSTLELTWPACVGCAVLARSFERSNTIPPQGCKECFVKHCWNGTLDTRKPNWKPSLLIKGSESEGGGRKKKGGAVKGHVSWNVLIFAAFTCIFFTF